MDKITKEALEESIAKWEGYVAKLKMLKGHIMYHHTLGAKECPLCLLFIKNNCIGCPVRDETEQNCCSSSPYYSVMEAKSNYTTNSAAIDDDLINIYQKEVDFLKSLREPKEEPCSE